MITLTAKIVYGDNKEIIIDKQNLISISHNIIDRSDIVMPSWGIISNSGKIEFVDYSGEIKQLAKLNQLSTNLPVTITLKDTLNNTKLDYTNFVTRKWNYEPNSREVSLDIGDKLLSWQDIVVKVKQYNSTTQKGVSGKDIYNELYLQTPSSFNLLTFDELESSTQLRLESLEVPIYISNDTTLWGAWNTLCVAAFAHIYINHKGETKFDFRV